MSWATNRSGPWWVQEADPSDITPALWREVAARIGGQYVPAAQAAMGVDGVIVTVDPTDDPKEGLRAACEQVKDALVEITGSNPLLYGTYGGQVTKS